MIRSVRSDSAGGTTILTSCATLRLSTGSSRADRSIGRSGAFQQPLDIMRRPRLLGPATENPRAIAAVINVAQVAQGVLRCP